MENGKTIKTSNGKKKDRIAILQLNPSNIKEPKKYTNPIYKKRKLVKGLRMKLKIKNNRNMIAIINCYASHSELTKKKTRKIQKDFIKV